MIDPADLSDYNGGMTDAPNQPPQPSPAQPDLSPPAAASPAAPPSPEVLKSAYQAFKKRWKLTRLDHESKVGRSPMSSGRPSGITGIMPPNQFPTAVWDELVKQGRLRYDGHGLYGMP